jgi:putative oxidoreductase
VPYAAVATGFDATADLRLAPCHPAAHIMQNSGAKEGRRHGRDDHCPVDAGLNTNEESGMPKHTTPQAETIASADLGQLVLRLTVGGLLAGHGGQKLFGWFNGPGLEGTSGWLGSMGFQPAKRWATLAGLSEFGGGTLTALGLLHPLGPITTLGAMLVAAIDVHGGKPVWATEGGAELPITNMAAATALIMTGPGAFSLDRALGIRLPKAVAALALLGVGASVIVAETRPKSAPPQMTDEAGAELQAGEGGSASEPL